MNLLRQIINFLLRLFAGRKNAASLSPTEPKKKPAAPPQPAPQPELRPEPAEDTSPPPPSKELTVTESTDGNTRVVTVTDNVLPGTFREFINEHEGWKGLYSEGEKGLGEFQQNHHDLAKELNLPDEIFNVLRAISDNEGKFEAVNGYDGAFLSFGIFQWTLGTGARPGELPALLLRLKETFPDTYQEYFGQHGLDVKKTTPDGGFLVLDGETMKSRQQKDRFRQPEWVYRFWRAGHDPKVQAVQVKHAIGRLEGFYFNWKIQGHRINELITSQYGVTLILDNHVNLPAHFYGALDTALTNAGLSNPANWDTAEEKQLIEEYLKQRRQPQPYKNRGTYGPMHNAAGRANAIGKYREEEPPLSEARLSFQYTPSAQRSIDDNFVAPPEGYDPEDYPGPEAWVEAWEGETG